MRKWFPAGVGRIGLALGLSVGVARAQDVTSVEVPDTAPAPVSDAAPAPVSDAAPGSDATPPSDAAPAPASDAAPASGAPPAEEAPEAFTGIRGLVVDAATGEPLIEATVKVVRGGDSFVRTDVDGRYALPVPPGEYALRIYYEVYEAKRVEPVVVRAGEATAVDVQLGADAAAVQEVVVEARVDRRSEAATLTERRKAAVVSDAVSAQEIARTPDASAGDAVKRVPSATVVDGRYVILRGLGGRYTSTLLNGVRLPSPEPDQPAVPLDLFPTALLANLTVAKTWQAALPGNFGGGALLIATNAFPSRFELKLKLGVSGDTQGTGRSRLAAEGGGLDFLGFDDGTRDLPAAVPDDRPVDRRTLSAAEQEAAGEAFANRWTLHRTMTLPGLSLSATAGDTLRLGGDTVGWLASVGLGHKEVRRQADVAKASLSEGEVVFREQLENETGVESGTLGALVNVGWQPSADHELNVFSLYTHAGDASAFAQAGYSETDGRDVEATRVQFVERALSFTQLAGFHRLAPIELRWQANYARTTRDEPETRELTYKIVEVDGVREGRFKDAPGSGELFRSALREDSVGGGVDLSLPLEGVTLQAGGAAQYGDRSFEARRFRYERRGSADLLALPPEGLFTAEHIGDGLRMSERTLPTDAYDATLLVAAWYVGADVSWLEPVRLVPGVRYEVALQTLESGSRFSAVDQDVPSVDREDSAVLPTLNAIYALTPEQNLRAGYSFTLARPLLREVAPFSFYDFVRRQNVSGNPDLDETRIHNADLRWEWFPAAQAGEVFAAGVFYKRFVDPIEQVVVNASAGDVSFANAEGADVVGGEVEARMSLGRVADALADLHLGLNATVVYSRIDLGAEQKRVQTHQERPLQGQSPYVVNGNLSWRSTATGTELTLLYNVFGERLVDVGIQGLPDVYEQPFHRLDASASQALGGDFTLKLSATNLLARDTELEQGGLTVYRSDPGIGGSLSLEWTP